MRLRCLRSFAWELKLPSELLGVKFASEIREDQFFFKKSTGLMISFLCAEFSENSLNGSCCHSEAKVCGPWLRVEGPCREGFFEAVGFSHS